MSISHSGSLTAEDYGRHAVELSDRLKRLSRKNSRQGKELRQVKGQMQDLLAFLRHLAEQKAEKAGRQDILDRLAEADQTQLQQWLTDLESS